MYPTVVPIADEKAVLAPSTSFWLTTDSTILPPQNLASQHAPSRDWRSRKLKPPPTTPVPSDAREFSPLPEDYAVGSRLRVRGRDDVSASLLYLSHMHPVPMPFLQQAVIDTSDAAYVLRHRRFEALEKRQRLREKEKIQHERYKLKERIDVLRAMPGHAFIKEADLSDSMEVDTTAQGEKLRRELLREAEELEQRYDNLLSRKIDQVLVPPEDVRPSPPLKIKFRLGSSSRTPSQDRIPTASTAHALRHHAIDEPISSPLRHASPAPSSPPSPHRATRPRRSTATTTKTSPSFPTAHLPRPPATTRSFEEATKTLPPNYIPDMLRMAIPATSRSNLRNSLPFGVKIPGVFDDQLDFELPETLLRAHSAPALITGRGSMGASTDIGDESKSENEALGLIYSPIETE